MINYEGIIRTIITGGSYVLDELEGRIDALWVEGKLTDAQRAELKRLAAEGARDSMQVDVIAKLAEMETRIYNLEHPTDSYPVWQTGQTSEKGVVYRYDVTGDGELDLVRYDGGRASTSLSIGKIEGWHMLDRELNIVATIAKDADGNFVIEYITPDEEPEVEEGA
jgi:hypothetical protein